MRRAGPASVIYPAPAAPPEAGILDDQGPEEIWFDRLPPKRRRQWSHPQRDRLELGAAILALLAVTAIVAGVLVLYPSPSHTPQATVAVEVLVNTTAPPRTINSSFWGFNVGPNDAPTTTLADAASETPARVVRFPGGAAGDELNYTTGTLTNDSGGAVPADENLSQFVAWCRTISCSPILELPGEIDEPATAAYYVAYTEATFGLHPLAWEIGNEPALWTHFGMPWSEWNLSQDLTPSASQYARVVQAYVSAIHKVDPTAPILGLPGVGTGSYDETTWINSTVALNGPNISGVAIHVYPAGAGPPTGANLSEFLANASGPHSLAVRLASDQAAIAAIRPGVPLYVTELGTGLAAGTYAPFLYTFPDVPFVASEIVATILSGVASVELAQVQTPHGGTWMDGNGTVHSLLALYTQLFPELGPLAVPVQLLPPVPGLAAVATSSGPGGTTELFVVNTNAFLAAQLSLAGSGLNLSSPTTRWSWNSSTGAPVSVDLPGAPATWTVPPVSVLLLKLDGGYLSPASVSEERTPALRTTSSAPGPAPLAAVRRDL
jgi:hypothetical protein